LYPDGAEPALPARQRRPSPCRRPRRRPGNDRRLVRARTRKSRDCAGGAGHDGDGAAVAVSGTGTLPRPRRIAVATLRLAGLFGGLVAIVVVGLISLRYGSIDITTSDAWDGI